MNWLSRRLPVLRQLARRPRGRGWRARVNQWRRKRRSQDESEYPAPVKPVRARPLRIELIEDYHYRLRVEGHPLFAGRPVERLGTLSILLPCEKQGREAIADAARHTQREASTVDVRYGWLGLSNYIRTDLLEQLQELEAWTGSHFRAFPLTLPLLAKDTEVLEDLIEGGAWGIRRMHYRPQVPHPHPLEFHMYTGPELAAPTDPESILSATRGEVRAPQGTAGQIVFHLVIWLRMLPPTTQNGEPPPATIARLQIEWPVPVVANEVSLQDVPGAQLWVDERLKRVVIENIPITLNPGQNGQLEGRANFRVVAHRAAALAGNRLIKGDMRIEIPGALLSGLQGQYFDAAGYVQHKNCDGDPLLSYRTELHVEWEYTLDASPVASPLLMERRLSWPVSSSIPDPFDEIERIFQEQGFALPEPHQVQQEGVGQRWLATRMIDGQELLVDIIAQRRLESSPTAVSSAPQTIRAQPGTFLGPRMSYDLSLRAYYRGRWELAAQQISWIEERLRNRLHLRPQES